MSSNSVVRRLLAALADDTPAFHARTYEPTGNVARRLLIALADASLAFTRHGTDGSYMDTRSVERNQTGQQQERLEEDVELILSEIEEVLEDEGFAELFVRSYAQKGGQGWSTFLDPGFYVGAAAICVVAGGTWDSFKLILGRVVKALRQLPGPPIPSPLAGDDSYDPEFEHMLRQTWLNAIRLIRQQDIEHSIDEATALHWGLFFAELERTLGYVRLRPDQYQQIIRIAAAETERRSPSQIIAKIVDEWLEQRPPGQ